MIVSAPRGRRRSLQPRGGARIAVAIHCRFSTHIFGPSFVLESPMNVVRPVRKSTRFKPLLCSSAYSSEEEARKHLF